MDYPQLWDRSIRLSARETLDAEAKQRALELNVITSTLFCAISQSYIKETVSLNRAVIKREPAPQQHNLVGSSRPKVVMDKDVAFRKRYKKRLSQAGRQRTEQAALALEAAQHKREIIDSTATLVIKQGE